MNDQDILEKNVEELKRWIIIATDRAALHTLAKEQVKFCKEQLKERKDVISKKIGDKK